MAQSRAVTVLLAALLAGAAAFPVLSENASEVPRGAADPVAPQVPGHVRADTGMDLLALAGRDYLVERGALFAQLATGPREEQPRIFVDLAELHVAHGLLIEARSYLAKADELGGADVATERTRRLTLILDVLGGEQVAPDHADMSDPDWPPADYFRLLNDVHLSAALTEADFLAAAKAAGHLPEELLAQGLPELLDAAVKGAYWQASRDLAGLMLSRPQLEDTPSLHYLLGRAAEMGEEFVAAFDSYRRAAQGRDVWAHRARLALIELAERTDALGPEDRLQLLRAARWLWEGDEAAADTLFRLAEAELAQSHLLNALAVMHDLQNRHPQSLFAQKSNSLSEVVLDDFYMDGLSGAMPLTEFIAGHARIAADRRMEPGFATRAEAFADFVLAQRITTLAVREYSEIEVYLAASEDLGLSEPTGSDRDRLRLKQAEALIAGGRLDQAEPLIEAPMLDPIAPNTAFREALRVSLLDERGDHQQLLNYEEDLSEAEFLLQRAEAYFTIGDWRNALNSYEALWEIMLDELPPSAAARMVLAAHRAGEGARLRNVVSDLKMLREAPNWKPIAAILAKERPDLFPLRKDILEEALLDDLSLREMDE